MKIGRFESKALSFVLMVAMLATYSMVALARDSRLAGEIVVSGLAADGSAPVVLVNGEQVRSGRSIFTSSSIITDKNSSATLSIGSLGTLRVAPDSSLTVSFDEDGIRSSLTKGSVTVLNSSNAVDVTLPNGSITKLTSGKSVTTVKDDDDDDDDNSTFGWIGWTVVLAGATAAIIFAAASGNNRVRLDGGTTVISPVRN